MTSLAPALARRTLGTRDELIYTGLVLIASTILIAAWALAALALLPGYVFSPIEYIGTVTSLACVWLTRRQNISCWPIGIVSVVFMGAFFVEIGLVGQAGLQWLYYFPIQFWGWYHWMYGGEQRSELRVSWLDNRERLAYVPIAIIGTAAFGALFGAYPDAVFTYWDASIVVASVIAQLLLSRKKVESWLLWMIPVNVSAIGLYALAGAYLFAALYVVFLVNAAVGLAQWIDAARAGAAE